MIEKFEKILKENLNDQEKKIFDMLSDECTQRVIAKELGITTPTLCRRVKEIRIKIRQNLKNNHLSFLL